MKSNFPYGFAGWASVQTYLATTGQFYLAGAVVSIILIFIIIVGIEHLVLWTEKRWDK